MPEATPAALIALWRAMELLSPQPLAKLDEEDATVSVAEERAPLPWHEAHPIRAQWLGDKRAWQHVVFCAPYSLDAAFEAIRRKHPEAERMPNERPQAGESAIAAFVVADDGRAILGSAMLASCAWAMSQALRDGPGSVGTAAFEQVASAFKAEWEELVEAEADDERAKELAAEGHLVGRPLDFVDLQTCNDAAARLLRLGEMDETDTLATGEVRIVSRKVAAREAHEPGERELLNSFFAEDLRMVAKEVEHGTYGKALREYLKSAREINTKARIDVEQDLAYVRKTVTARNLPLGRWPSASSHIAGLGQQLAINTILTDSQTHIYAVNGPPGTGKTVMLRDLLAAIVVERATQLAALDKPEDAFADPQQWNGGRRKLHPLKKNLTGNELVLACATNAAAENVTAEIPARDAIAVEWETDYFTEIATGMLNPKDCDTPRPAWGMIAAVMGSRHRNKTFVSRFWWEGMKQRLENPEPEPWEQAVAQFRQAREKVERMVEERAAYSDLREQLESAGARIERSRREAEQAKGQLAEVDVGHASDAVEAARRERVRYEQQRAEHRRYRPSLWQRVLTHRMTEWRRADAHIADAIATAVRAQREASEQHTREHERASELSAILEVCEARASEAQAEADELRELIPKAVVQWGADFKDAIFADAQWEAPEQRECREQKTPWVDAELNAARTELFVAALSLHRAFIEGAAKQMRDNLACATELISGQAGSVSEAKAKLAWQSLFMAVPMVSTTFASFPYLFRHLGREALGWLLVDEAGQAVPQAAVGPIWRSRKAVVVGDPMQLEPIVQLPKSIERVLRTEHGIDGGALREDASVQTQADQLSRVGTFRGDGNARTWVGAPLNVHRRCEDPMFKIVNEVAYEHQMINCTPERPELPLQESHWIDVPQAPSSGNWVPAEGEALSELLQGLRYQMADFTEVFLITPFRDVANRIAKHRKTYPGLTTGTIHTAQGKEADIVILILGGSTRHQYARAWAAEKPNLLNVAVSRTRRRLYVIGDREAWSRLPHFETLAAAVKPLQLSRR